MNKRVVQTIEQLERFKATVTDALAIPRDAAQFLHTLILATTANRAVEIGTGYGYSGLWMASALAETGGTLITIDRDQRKVDIARTYFASAGLDHHVDLRTGTASEILASLDGPIDFVLNDADKDNCIRYVELLANKLSDRAVVLTDNTMTHPDQLAEFLAWVRKHRDFETAAVPVGNGMELSVYVRGTITRQP